MAAAVVNPAIQIIQNNPVPPRVHALLNGQVAYRDNYAAVDQRQENAREGGFPDAGQQRCYNVFAKTLEEQLEGFSTDHLSPLCPHSVIQLFVAQHHAKVNSRPGNVGNAEPMRMRNFYCFTIGFAFTLLARIIRVVIRTGLLPLSLLFSAYKQNKYGARMVDAQQQPQPLQGSHNIVTEDLKRYGYEWIDLFVTLASFPIAIIHTIAPQAINLNALRDYYIERADEVRLRNRAHKIASEVYAAQQEQLQAAFRAAQAAVAAPPAPAQG